MKVGTDGVLLGAWADVEQASHILDIGTGSGLLALMLAQRQPNASIEAIEIEQNAYEQACENALQCAWSNRITVRHTSLQDFSTQKKFNVIVSNPPFFSKSLHNPNLQRRTARHNDTLLPEELAQHSLRLLASNGKLAVIYPLPEAELFCQAAHKIGFYTCRKTFIIPSVGKTAKRVLVELQLTPCSTIENELCIEEHARHTYSNEYKNLTKDFYLNF